MNTVGSDTFARVFAELEARGFLFESDPHLPNVCSLVTGERMRGSWWSHPLAHTIFNVNQQLDEHGDVLITKLISGKITFVHRQLWSELIAIGSSNADWQLNRLTADSTKLLKLMKVEGQVRTDRLVRPLMFKAKLGDAARQLEQRLLVVGSEVHTETGAHAKLLETWHYWQNRLGFKRREIDADEAMSLLELRVKQLNKEFGANATLPWATRKNSTQ